MTCHIKSILVYSQSTYFSNFEQVNFFPVFYMLIRYNGKWKMVKIIQTLEI